MSPQELLELAREAGALMKGHFLLSSGLHSPAYFQSARLLQRPERATQLGAALAERVAPGSIDLTIAPAVGAVLVAHEVARALGVRAVFAERDKRSGELTLRRGFTIDAGERAFVLEDVVTTGGSLRETMQVVKAHGGRVSATGALVDRSGDSLGVLGAPFFSLARLELETYPVSDCPLCRAGSTAIKPGSRPPRRVDPC